MSVVADVGAVVSRIGVSGQPSPTILRTDVVSRSYTYTDPMGLSLDPDALECVLRAGMANLGTPEASGVLLAEPSQVSAAMRRQMGEVLFDRIGVARAFLSKRAALSAYAHGHTTGIVLDVGGSHSCCSVVADGWVMPERVMDSAIGGDVADVELQTRLEVAGVTLGGARLDRDLVRKLKESGEIGLWRSALPDGTKLDVGQRILHDLPDMFFSSSVGAQTGLSQRRPCSASNSKVVAFAGVHVMLDTCMRVEDDGHPAMRHLSRCVILSGGSSCLRGFADRLRTWKSETDLAVGDFRVWHTPCRPPWTEKLETAVPVTEHSCWTGGSILASLGAFEESWVTKADFEERGVRAFDEKCP